jgi:hypothetical protein
LVDWARTDSIDIRWNDDGSLTLILQLNGLVTDKDVNFSMRLLRIHAIDIFGLQVVEYLVSFHITVMDIREYICTRCVDIDDGS